MLPFAAATAAVSPLLPEEVLAAWPASDTESESGMAEFDNGDCGDGGEAGTITPLSLLLSRRPIC